jgi:DNA polymerase/3'-5' exonuclease PolX
MVNANKDLIDSVSNQKNTFLPSVDTIMTIPLQCYTAFLQPSTGILRQVDILVAPPSQLYTTILGWTGSRQFERSLRSYAEVQ